MLEWGQLKSVNQGICNSYKRGSALNALVYLGRYNLR